MKTTLDLPDELLRTVKIRAVQEHRKLKEMVTELIQRGLAAEPEAGRVRNRVQLPLIRCAHEARPGEELTPDRVAQLLLAEETDRLSRA